MEYSERVVLHFPREIANQPLIYRLVKHFDVQFNILKAQIVTEEEEGLLVLGLSGTRVNVKKAVGYLKEQGVRVQPLNKDITINKNRCTDCGACVAQCPAEALNADPSTAVVSLNGQKCIACELCVPACFYNAIDVNFT